MRSSLRGSGGHWWSSSSPDTDAANAWANDPEYVALKKIRGASTTHRMEVIASSFAPRGA